MNIDWNQTLSAVGTLVIPPLAVQLAVWLGGLIRWTFDAKQKAEIERVAKLAVTAIAARLRHVDSGVAKEEAAISEAQKLSPRKFASLPADEQKTLIQSAYFREVKIPSMAPPAPLPEQQAVEIFPPADPETRVTNRPPPRKS